MQSGRCSHTHSQILIKAFVPTSCHKVGVFCFVFLNTQPIFQHIIWFAENDTIAFATAVKKLQLKATKDAVSHKQKHFSGEKKKKKNPTGLSRFTLQAINVDQKPFDVEKVDVYKLSWVLVPLPSCYPLDCPCFCSSGLGWQSDRKTLALLLSQAGPLLVFHYRQQKERQRSQRVTNTAAVLDEGSHP